MSLAQDLRTRAKHRGYTPWQLIQKIGRLEREADNTACQLVAMATEIDELRAERNRLNDNVEQAAIDYSIALDDLRIAKAETERTQAALTATQAQLANAEAVTVHATGQRDISAPEDRPTIPVPLWASPLAADDTQPLPAA